MWNCCLEHFQLCRASETFEYSQARKLSFSDEIKKKRLWFLQNQSLYKSDRTTIYPTLASFSALLVPKQLEASASETRENVFWQRILSKYGVCRYRRNNHGHIYKNVGMAEESEPWRPRRTWWDTNDRSCRRNRRGRKTRGKNCAGT